VHQLEALNDVSSGQLPSSTLQFSLLALNVPVIVGVTAMPLLKVAVGMSKGFASSLARIAQ
jgi:hypothetical protein